MTDKKNIIIQLQTLKKSKVKKKIEITIPPSN
jgi:hypothetical protein